MLHFLTDVRAGEGVLCVDTAAVSPAAAEDACWTSGTDIARAYVVTLAFASCVCCG